MRTPLADFEWARAEAVRVQTDLRERAARTVVAHALTEVEEQFLLAMLDLPAPVPASAPDDVLDRALRDYVHAVAQAAGVPEDCVTCEVTDTATAYLPLGRRSAAHPDHDLMLVWGERRGWAVLVETAPGEPAIVLGARGGDTAVAPGDVARFVQATVDQPRTAPAPTTRSGRPDRTRLAARLRCRTPEENRWRSEP
ncbi:hypothetical protein GCM10023148_26500 [Actinokineospora soli]